MFNLLKPGAVPLVQIVIGLEHFLDGQFIRTAFLALPAFLTQLHALHHHPGKVNGDSRRHPGGNDLVSHSRCNHDAVRTWLAIFTPVAKLLAKFNAIFVHKFPVFLGYPVRALVKGGDSSTDATESKPTRGITS